MSSQKALLLGASGLVGAELLKLLIRSDTYDKIIVLVRKPLEQSHDKVEQVITDFNQLHNYADCFNHADVFSCLGTTIKNAKTRNAFKEVDYTYPFEAAKLAKQRGTGAFFVVTAMGANAKSGIFYNRVKGQLEEDLKGLRLRTLHIFRPSLLIGDRQEFRIGEKAAALLMAVLGFTFVGPLRKYKAIHASTVAKAMLTVAKKSKKGIHIYTSDKIEQRSG